MSLGIETVKMLYRNTDALTYIIDPRQSSGLSQNDRAAALNAVLVTAEAGRKLAEAVLVDSLTEHHKSGGNAVDTLSMSTTVGAVAEEMVRVKLRRRS